MIYTTPPNAELENRLKGQERDGFAEIKAARLTEFNESDVVFDTCRQIIDMLYNERLAAQRATIEQAEAMARAETALKQTVVNPNALEANTSPELAREKIERVLQTAGDQTQIRAAHYAKENN